MIFRYALAVSFIAIIIYSHFSRFAVPGFVVVLIAIGMWVEAVGRYQQSRFVVKNNLLELRQGVFATVTRRIPLNAIQSVDVIQSLLGRFLGYGQLDIRFSVDLEEHVIHLQFVDSPQQLQARIKLSS